ncbi:MAG: hypothetical protein GY821_08360 [Gammaproteobacteria bacterium]|nr:hypothetical protein [Gammaproteobacteria bacterium]
MEGAAKQNYSPAQFTLGCDLYSKKDIEAAKYWITKAYMRFNTSASDFCSKHGLEMTIKKRLQYTNGWQRLYIALSGAWFIVVFGMASAMCFYGGQTTKVFEYGAPIWLVPTAFIWSFYFTSRWIHNGFKK